MQLLCSCIRQKWLFITFQSLQQTIILVIKGEDGWWSRTCNVIYHTCNSLPRCPVFCDSRRFFFIVGKGKVNKLQPAWLKKSPFCIPQNCAENEAAFKNGTLWILEGRGTIGVETHRLLLTVLSLTAYKHISKPSLKCCVRHCAGGPGEFVTWTKTGVVSQLNNIILWNTFQNRCLCSNPFTNCGLQYSQQPKIST